MQGPGNRWQAAQSAADKRRSIEFVRAFIADTRPVASGDAEDERQAAQMIEWATAPRADSSSDVIRRVIARVECLA